MGHLDSLNLRRLQYTALGLAVWIIGSKGQVGSRVPLIRMAAEMDSPSWRAGIQSRGDGLSAGLSTENARMDRRWIASRKASQNLPALVAAERMGGLYTPPRRR